jgi:hypothetical protein
VHGLVLGFADYICQVHGVKRHVKSIRIEHRLLDEGRDFTAVSRTATWD